MTLATEQLTNEVIKAIAPHIAELLQTSQSISAATDVLKANHTSFTEATHSLHDHLDHLKCLPIKLNDPNSNSNPQHLALKSINDIKDVVTLPSTPQEGQSSPTSTLT